MGTTTANRHGLRKAAEKNRNRHAQRTALPPKGGVTKVEVPEYAEQYGKMTQPQLRKVLREKFGLTPKAGIPVGQLLEMVLKSERVQRVEIQHEASEAASVAIGASAPTTLGKAKASVSDAAPDASKSFAKASAVMDVAVKHGWDVKPQRFDGDVVELLMTRGEEALWVSWTSGVLTTDPMPSYTIADRTIKLRNASAVKQYAERAPETGAAELVKVASNRFFRKRATEPKRSRLPFDTDLATDEEVLAALIGKSVAWHNQYRETEEVAIVGVRHGKQPVQLRARENGERVVWFCCPQTGFRAFSLSQLTKVGKPVIRTKGQRRETSADDIQEG